MSSGGPIEVAWVSGRLSDATVLRAKELRIAELIQVPDGHKIPPFQALLDKRGLGWDEVAFVGDDLADIAMLRRVGVPIAVANAVDEVKALAMYVTRAEGGKGAFQLLHSVYDRKGEPCRKCKSPIERIVLGGRSTHFCANCQPR